MSQTARIEIGTIQSQQKRREWILAGLWMLMAGVVHLLLLRTHSVLERNIYGITAVVVRAFAISPDADVRALRRHGLAAAVCGSSHPGDVGDRPDHARGAA